MTAQLVHLEDYRPKPVGVSSLWLNAVFHIWLGLAVAAVVPLAMVTRWRK